MAKRLKSRPAWEEAKTPFESRPRQQEIGKSIKNDKNPYQLAFEQQREHDDRLRRWLRQNKIASEGRIVGNA